LIPDAASAALRANRRIDQWLWFARFAKSRSLAARLCAGGLVAINGVAVTKANHAVRVGDIVALPQGPWLRTVRVVALGDRRGPAIEARALFEDAEPASRRVDLLPTWEPLLGDDEAGAEPP